MELTAFTATWSDHISLLSQVLLGIELVLNGLFMNWRENYTQFIMDKEYIIYMLFGIYIAPVFISVFQINMEHLY